MWSQKRPKSLQFLCDGWFQELPKITSSFPAGLYSGRAWLGMGSISCSLPGCVSCTCGSRCFSIVAKPRRSFRFCTVPWLDCPATPTPNFVKFGLPVHDDTNAGDHLSACAIADSDPPQ